MPAKTTKAKSASEDKNKKTRAKKTTKKKPGPKPKKKIATKKTSVSKKKPVKTVTVDVISDEPEETINEPIEDVSQENEADIENLDSQKKYYSELVSEIKEKQGNLAQEKSKQKDKSIKLYRRIALQFFLLILIFVLGVVYFTGTKLTVAISPASEVINDSVQFVVASSQQAETSLPAARVVPGEIIETNITSEKVYETTGEEKIGEEVSGEVVIYNNYSRNQPLVATTRLLTPDQKQYRISEGVNVPAGGSVRVEAYADTVSADMAINSTRMTIPGLWAGLQDQIYAENPEPFEYKSKINHFVRQGDLDLAANDIRETVKNKLKQEIDWQIRPGDAVVYDIDENKSLLTIDAQLGEELEDFRAKADNQAIIVRFSQQKAEELLQAKLAFSLSQEKEIVSFSSENINYVLDDYDLENDTATITAHFNGLARLKGNQNFIDKNKLTNLKQEQIKQYLNSFNEIDNFELKFSPSFLKRSPHLSDRIEIIIK